MKRINLLLMLLVLTVGTIEAQSKFGIKTEVGFEKTQDAEMRYALGSSDEIFYALESQGRSSTYSIGLSARKQAGFIFLSSDVMLSKYSKSFDVNQFQLDAIIDGAVSQEYMQLDIPLKIGLTKDNFHVAVGPQIQYTLNKTNGLSELATLTDKSRSLSTGYNMSMGYDFGPIFTEFSLYKNFSAEGEGLYFDRVKAGYKNRSTQFKIAIGYHF